MDDDLEEEVAQELQNYGQVQSVLIFEVTEDDFPPEEAIRIFVELATIEEATKANPKSQKHQFLNCCAFLGSYCTSW